MTDAARASRRRCAADRLHARHRRRSWSTVSPRTRPPRCSRPTATRTDTRRTTADSRSSTRALLQAYVTALDAAGMQVHFHALGDRAVREALDAVEAARAANGPSDGRHHLAHLQVVDEAEVPRFAELNDAVANIQALWATPRGPARRAHPALPAGRRRSAPLSVRRPRARAARLAAGSDWPVSSADPMDAIHIAVNRGLPGIRPPAARRRPPAHRPRHGDGRLHVGDPPT